MFVEDPYTVPINRLFGYKLIEQGIEKEAKNFGIDLSDIHNFLDKFFSNPPAFLSSVFISEIKLIKPQFYIYSFIY